jgi:hypothetical protein
VDGYRPGCACWAPTALARHFDGSLGAPGCARNQPDEGSFARLIELISLAGGIPLPTHRRHAREPRRLPGYPTGLRSASSSAGTSVGLLRHPSFCEPILGATGRLNARWGYVGCETHTNHPIAPINIVVCACDEGRVVGRQKRHDGGGLFGCAKGFRGCLAGREVARRINIPRRRPEREAP